jgi:hypothetical protein
MVAEKSGGMKSCSPTCFVWVGKSFQRMPVHGNQMLINCAARENKRMDYFQA